VETSTQAFHAEQITQRPAFVLTDAIGDKAVFSGLGRVALLTATPDAMLMLADTAGFASFAAHCGAPPKA
jgi:hypothetical protein